MVELELRLYVAEERLCIVLALADKHHEVQFFEGFEIHGNADIEMDGLRVASRPLRGILNCRMVSQGVRRPYLKGSAVGMLPGLLIVAVVREIVREEAAIIGEEIRDAFLLLRRSLPDRHDGARLHGLAPLLPLFDSLLAGLCGVPCHALQFAAEHFEDILVLILVDKFSELRRNFQICLRLIFEPTAKSHEALDEIDSRSLLVEAFDSCR